MDTTKKLYIALALLAALGGGIYLQNKKEKADTQAHSFEAKNAQLPTVNVNEETRKAIDSIELTRPAEEKDNKEATADDKAVAAVSKSESVSLSKKSEEAWELKQPVTYAASAANVKSLLENLDKLKITEQISTSTAEYDKYGVSDEKAIHAVFKKGGETVLDAYFGENGSRGQMVRLGGKDGVYALKGFSKYLYNRDANGWRDKTIFKFDDKAVTKVTVQNEHGNFVFEKKDDKWTSQYAEKEKDKPKEIADFKSSKIDDLVRAYKGLNASSFADGKPLSEVGLEKPVATVTLELTGGTGKYVLTVGGTSEGSSRWVQANTGPQVYSVSSWTADWATAEVSKFQEKKDDKKDKDKAEADPHAGMPGMPPGMAGMPPGMQGMPEEPEE